MTIQWRAEVQYGDMDGTVAIDDADCERWEDILGIDGWLPLGIQVNCGHPALGARRSAASSGTYLRVWAVEWARLKEGYSLPDLLASERPVEVTEFVFETSDVDYPTAANALAVLLRGSKRLDIVVWDRTVINAGLRDSDFDIVGERYLVWENEAWVERAHPYSAGCEREPNPVRRRTLVPATGPLDDVMAGSGCFSREYADGDRPGVESPAAHDEAH